MSTETPPPTKRLPASRLPRFRTVLLVVLALVLLLWVTPALLELIRESDGIEGLSRPYLVIFGFVTFDAVFPVLPSESLLTASSTLAAQGDSDLVLGYIALAGALGAIVGDSLLYWLSRTAGRELLERRLGELTKNERVALAIDVLGATAPLLIVLGRFVPGVRFAVNVMMGVSQYPYPKFLLFSTIGGSAWAAYTCVFSFWIGRALDGYPVLSILTSVVFTTALVALLYFPLKRRYDERLAAA
jgi:membrane-associated protein